MKHVPRYICGPEKGIPEFLVGTGIFVVLLGLYFIIRGIKKDWWGVDDIIGFTIFISIGAFIIFSSKWMKIIELDENKLTFKNYFISKLNYGYSGKTIDLKEADKIGMVIKHAFVEVGWITTLKVKIFTKNNSSSFRVTGSKDSELEPLLVYLKEYFKDRINIQVKS